MYIWEHPDWPNFHYDITGVQNLMYQYALEVGEVSGGVAQLSDPVQQETIIDLMVAEALKTSEIEGEYFQAEDIRSSLLKQLGYAVSLTGTPNPQASGVAHLMLSVRQTYDALLTDKQLFEWHRLLLSASSQARFLEIGAWRTSPEPMQVVSGPIGKERIHFEAPPSHRVPEEMEKFIHWFNETHPKTGTIKIPGPVRAAISHLYFESIHPFNDGNGRIGRAIAEKALSQDLGRPVLLSLSASIHKNRKTYYHELSRASRLEQEAKLDITSWIRYFVQEVYDAQLMAKVRMNFIFQKVQFWNFYDSLINERQRRVLKRLFEAGVDGFEGGINTRKYIIIADCSKATATRDLADLLEKGCLQQLSGGGRNTRYELRLRE